MRRNLSSTNLLLAATLALGAAQAQALTALSDDSMSDVSGAGLAFPFDQFYLQMAPTSFIELTGSDPTGTTTFIRGDLRYYGLTMSRAVDENGIRTTTNLINLDGTDCTNAGFFGLGCAGSSEHLLNFANFDNPYIWRAFNYEGYTPAGGPKVNDRPVFEILGPSNMDDFRWALMGELESGRLVGAPVNGLIPINGSSCSAGNTGAGTGNNCITQFQNLILGKPVSLARPPSIAGGESATNAYTAPVMRFLQYAGTTGAAGSNPSTYGIQYLHRLSGDYRLTVNTSSGSGARGDMPVFSNEEGLYFRDVEAYLPLGQLHYQALVFDDSQPGSSGSTINNGNITIELTAIPSQSDVYNDFYGYEGSYTNGYDRVNKSARYYETHGYAEWGTQFPEWGDVCEKNSSNACRYSQPSNFIDGPGNSQVRFAGPGYDGSTFTQTLELAAIAVTEANFPNNPGWNSDGTDPSGYCFGGFGGDTECEHWNGSSAAAISENFNFTLSPITSSSTNAQVVAAGGMVFVARNGGSWMVRNDSSAVSLEDDYVRDWIEEQNEVRWARTENYTHDCGPFCSREGLRARAPDINRIRSRALEVINDDFPGVTPELEVTAINLGASRVLGLQINHLKVETLGGQ